jgi:16S rRNA (adenine1518-N6/adenine1519-N6)-dimethyltransferase
VTVIEIGPGPGGLTRALLAEGAASVIAVERDARAIAALAEIAQRHPGRLTVVEGDALAFDATPYLGDGPARVVANLPYNIATALLVSWLTTEPWPPWFDRLVLMFQREVAERIVLRPAKVLWPAVGAGRLAHPGQNPVRHQAAGLLAAAQGDVLAGGTPAAREPAACCERALLERVTGAAFGQRRKMLRQSLKTLGTDPLPLLAAAGIEPTARAEDIAIEGFVALARALETTRMNA